MEVPLLLLEILQVPFPLLQLLHSLLQLLLQFGTHLRDDEYHQKHT